MPNPRGRPRSFDRNEALLRALEIFWAHGYEGATLEDLQKAMGGISPPSFYAAFGSKERLFREVVDLYCATVGAPIIRGLREQTTARSSIEAMLRASAESFSQPGKPHGCMIVLGSVNCTQANKSVRECLHDLRALRSRIIKERLTQGVNDGDLPAESDLDAITAFYVTFLNGLALSAQDGACREDLMNAVDGAMAAWDGLATRIPRRRKATSQPAARRKPQTKPARTQGT